MELRLLQLASANITVRSGGMHLRNYHLAKQLAKVADITHIGFAAAGEEEVTTSSHEGMRIILAPKARAYTLAKLARGALGRTPVTFLNFYSAPMAAALSTELAAYHYDTVLIEGIEMVPYLPVIRAAKPPVRFVILDWHNIESELVARHSSNAATPLHRLYMLRTASQLKRVETDLLDSCDLHLVTSEREQLKLSSLRPGAKVIVIENGVDAAHLASYVAVGDGNGHSPGRRRILFVCAMDYSANVDATIYFAEQIWPRVHQSFPELAFTIVGRNPPERVRAMGLRPGVEVTGTVADVRPYYCQAIAAVVPIRVAGGTRLKILESMAAGVPVVSTVLGAEGLRIDPGIHFLSAASPAEFYNQIERLRADSGLWTRISSAGRAGRAYL